MYMHSLFFPGKEEKAVSAFSEDGWAHILLCILNGYDAINAINAIIGIAKKRESFFAGYPLPFTIKLPFCKNLNHYV